MVPEVKHSPQGAVSSKPPQIDFVLHALDERLERRRGSLIGNVDEQQLFDGRRHLGFTISRFFSSTTMISVAMTLNAATKMMVAMTRLEHDLLHLERGEQVVVELAPIHRVVGAAAEVGLELARDARGDVDVGEAHLDAGDAVAVVEEALAS